MITMKTINVDLSSNEALNLIVGRQGENEVTQVVFDFSALKTEFGTGTLSLSVKRPKEYVPYAQTMTVSGTNATWLVNETDTGNFGCGEIQLTYTVNDKVAKTVIYKYTVYRSIGVDGEYPIPGQTWQEEIEEDIAEIKEDLGDLSDLETTAKNNLVAAINEAAQSGGGGGGGGVAPYTNNPEALGTASPGSSTRYSRGDHVHPMPTAANVGAIASPSNPSTGAFLVWNGSAWVAQTLSTWQGGNY